MSSVRNPRGPQPASVYWRRRIVALLGLVAVIVCIVLIVSALTSGGGGAPTPSPSTTPSSTPVATDGKAACNPAVIRIVAVTDSNSYAPDQQPLLSMTITNTGAVACTLDVGTSEQAYYIVSGSDPIWNSLDCQSGAASLPRVLKPNETLTTSPFPWDRTRSSTDTCGVARPAVTAEGATYRLSVKLGDLASASDTPFILE